jgi:hypothetical protein
MEEFQEYSSLIAKSETEQLSYEELQRLNELHILFIQQCYQNALNSEEVQTEMRKEIDEYYLVTTVLLNFIDEQGLTDAMQDYFNATIDEVVEKSMTADMVQ